MNLSIPDPIVLKNDVPCKGLKLLSGSKKIIVGLENGLIKVVNRDSFEIIAE